MRGSYVEDALQRRKRRRRRRLLRYCRVYSSSIVFLLQYTDWHRSWESIETVYCLFRSVATRFSPLNDANIGADGIAPASEHGQQRLIQHCAAVRQQTEPGCLRNLQGIHLFTNLCCTPVLQEEDLRAGNLVLDFYIAGRSDPIRASLGLIIATLCMRVLVSLGH